jgi:hypothetical protein
MGPGQLPGDSGLIIPVLLVCLSMQSHVIVHRSCLAECMVWGHTPAIKPESREWFKLYMCYNEYCFDEYL